MLCRWQHSNFQSTHSKSMSGPTIAETPFGGVKDSGYGREGGTEGLTHYTVVKNVSHLMR
jgi:acyl-CoA reductase-like NAD-dependent aldehyde dehydrogenase